MLVHGVHMLLVLFCCATFTIHWCIFCTSFSMKFVTTASPPYVVPSSEDCQITDLSTSHVVCDLESLHTICHLLVHSHQVLHSLLLELNYCPLDRPMSLSHWILYDLCVLQT